MKTNKTNLTPDQADFTVVSTDNGSEWHSNWDASVVVLTEEGFESVVEIGHKIKHLHKHEIVAEVSISALVKAYSELAVIKADNEKHQAEVSVCANQLLNRFEDGDYDCSDVWETITNRYYDATGAFKDDLYDVVMDELDKRNAA